MSNDKSDPPEHPSASQSSPSGSRDSHHLEKAIQDITRGIEACTTSSLAVKTLVEQYLGHAIGVIRTDLAEASTDQYKRLDALTLAVQEIDLGNQRALGAMQELINVFNASASLERGVALQMRDALMNSVARLQSRVLEPSSPSIMALPVKKGRTELWAELWDDFKEWSWQKKGRILGILVTGMLSWIHAAPAIAAAIKMLWVGE